MSDQSTAAADQDAPGTAGVSISSLTDDRLRRIEAALRISAVRASIGACQRACAVMAAGHRALAYRVGDPELVRKAHADVALFSATVATLTTDMLDVCRIAEQELLTCP